MSRENPKLNIYNAKTCCPILETRLFISEFTPSHKTPKVTNYPTPKGP